ncbi:hypothetical protein J6590_053223 [Homalodisca vitripennis]|nr:hypothetical protein J6590_053223 [Homalodisca vitripennis]
MAVHVSIVNKLYLCEQYRRLMKTLCKTSRRNVKNVIPENVNVDQVPSVEDGEELLKERCDKYGTNESFDNAMVNIDRSNLLQRMTTGVDVTPKVLASLNRREYHLLPTMTGKGWNRARFLFFRGAITEIYPLSCLMADVT